MNKKMTGPAVLSRRVRYLVWGFLAVYGLAEMLAWLAPALLSSGSSQWMLALQNLALPQVAALPLWLRAVGLALALPALLLLAAAVRALSTVLRSFEQGAFFTPQTRHGLRRFTALLSGGTALSMLEPTLRSAVFSLLQPAPGGRLTLAFELSGSDLWTLLLCAVFYVIAHLMDEGQRLADENGGFV